MLIFAFFFPMQISLRQIGTILDFVEIQRFVVNTLRIGQNFISMYVIVKESYYKKTFGGSFNPLGWARVKQKRHNPLCDPWYSQRNKNNMISFAIAHGKSFIRNENETSVEHKTKTTSEVSYM